MKLTSRSKGQIAQLKIELEAANKNYIISRPSVDCYYDLILDPGTKKEEIFRAQIKFCNRLHGNHLELRLDDKKSKRIYYSDSWIDCLLVYIPKFNVILKYGQKHFHHKKRLTINLDDINSPYYYKNFIW